MKHIGAIANRELSSYFTSPMAYVVLTLWSVLAGTFFLSNLIGFQEQLMQAQRFQAFDIIEQMNLNDGLINPFISSMWIVLLFLLPAVTMGLFASEKANGTEELLLTSPITIWEIVLGKFLAASLFVTLMMGIVGFFPAILFVFGDPELGMTLSALLGLFLVSVSYVAVGAFASSLTRNQLIAWLLSLVLLLVFGLMLPFMVEIGFAGDPSGSAAQAARYVATAPHFESLLTGLVETADLVYFAVVTGIFLLLARAAIESVRWR